MKVGADNKRQVRMMILLLAIAAITVAFAYNSLFGSKPATTTASVKVVAAPKRPARSNAGSRDKEAGVPQVAENTLDPSLRLDILKASQGIDYEGGKRNIFRMAEAPPPPLPTPVVDPRTVATPVPGPTPLPPPPPITLRFFGFSNKPGEGKKVFLSQGDEIFVAHEGEIVNRRYKVVEIRNTPDIKSTSVVIEDVLNNNRQPIPLTPGQVSNANPNPN